MQVMWIFHPVRLGGCQARPPPIRRQRDRGQGCDVKVSGRAEKHVNLRIRPMKIVDAKINVCCPGRNFVTLKLITEDGIYGLGDATLNGRELAVAGYLNEHILPLLIGRDARRIEDIWQYLYKGAYWRRGPVTMTSIAAVDTALWDIKAKSMNAPLYQLLGGASRDGVMV